MKMYSNYLLLWRYSLIVNYMSTNSINTKRKKYPSDISKNGWKTLKAHLPSSKSNDLVGGRPAVDLKEVINGIFYVLKTGCSWRSLPGDLPH